MNQEKVWDEIAEKWAAFRTRPVEEVVEFLKGRSGKVLDLGCGSGRNFLDREDGKLEFYGVDFSEKLLEVAQKKDYVELRKGYCYDVPYGDGFFDYVMFVRALHCVDLAERRRKSLEEVYRVLKSGGEALISVWGRGQDRIKNRDKESYVPWSINGKKVMRYTYVYDVDELRAELEDVGFEVVNLKVGKNIVVIARKG